jgi:putative transposase
MPTYVRWFTPGGTFFFTVVTARRQPILCEPVAREWLRAAICETRRRWPFEILAVVLLPDHLHTLWRLPDDDEDFDVRWSFLKGRFTRGWLARGGREMRVSESQWRHRRRGVWQRRYWEHRIRDEDDYRRHCDYIHYNPVKHGLAACAHAWPFSSFPRFVGEGRYRPDWHCSCNGPMEPPTFDDLDETAME